LISIWADTPTFELLSSTPFSISNVSLAFI
jgi:hypothetical protein